MSLSKQLTAVRILFQGQGATSSNRVEYEVTVQNSDITIEPEFFRGGAMSETIGASKISNLRGFRVSVDLSYNSARELTLQQIGTGSQTQSSFRSMFNEALNCFGPQRELLSLSGVGFKSLHIKVQDEGGSFVAIPDSNASVTFLSFVPDSMSYSQKYSNQIGRFSPSIRLVGKTLMPDIPTELEGVL